MSYQPQQPQPGGGSNPYSGAPVPGVPMGQPLPQSGYGPPPIPGNRPTSTYQPQGPYQSYAPPAGPPPGQQQQAQYYPPPPGPPSGNPQYPQQQYLPPQGYPPQQQYAPPQQYPPPQGYPGYQAAPPFQGAPQSYYPPAQPQNRDPLWYLGTPVPDPFGSYGVQPIPGFDPSKDADAIRKATKGFGTDDTTLISTLVPLSALKMEALAQYYVAKHGKKLVDVLDSETSSWFKMGIHGLAMGPLAWDAELVNQAVAGAGTNEQLLNELILGRPSAEIRLLSAVYRHKYNRDLTQKISGDLSGKTERMFVMALNPNRPPDSLPVNQAEVDRDVDILYKAGQGKLGTDEMAFCDILINRPQPHITAVIGTYGTKYRSLSKVIKSEFSGHMREGLLHIVEGAKPKRDGHGIWRDAKLLDKAMVGFGTKDAQLVWRLVRAHWDSNRMQAIKEAYHRRTRKTLEARVASETSGSYKKLVVALVNTPVK